MIPSATDGLDHFECLQKLYDQIENILSQFKSEKLKANILIKLFLIKNRYEFVHNIIPIIVCLLGLLVPFEFKKYYLKKIKINLVLI